VWRGVCKHFIARGFSSSACYFVPFLSREEYPLQPDPIRYIPSHKENQSTTASVNAPKVSWSPTRPTTNECQVHFTQQQAATERQRQQQAQDEFACNQAGRPLLQPNVRPKSTRPPMRPPIYHLNAELNHLCAKAANNARLATLPHEEAARQVKRLRQAQHQAQQTKPQQQGNQQQQQGQPQQSPYQQTDPTLLQLIRSRYQSIALLQQTLLQISQTQNQQLQQSKQIIIKASPPSCPVWFNHHKDLEVHMELLCNFKKRCLLCQCPQLDYQGSPQ
jgi:hypothetical protein